MLFYGHRQLHCLCQTDDTYKDIAEDVEKRFDTSKCEIYKSLPKA